MSDAFDDIVASFGHRPGTDSENDPIQERAWEWAEQTQDMGSHPTPLHQSMLPQDLLIEMRHAPLFELLIPAWAEEVPALMMTQMVYSAMVLSAISFEGPASEGLDQIADLYSTLGALLKSDPHVREMVITGQKVVEAERDRLEYNERLDNEQG